MPILTDKRLRVLAPVGFLALAVVFFLFFGYRSVYAQLNALNLIPHDETLTELYFTLPLPLSSSRAGIVSFSFTIHNREGRDMDYPYVASVKAPTGTLTLLKGTAHLLSGGYAVIPVKYAGPTLGTRTFYVALPDQEQSIHFSLPHAR